MKLSRGLDIRVGGAPRQSVEGSPPIPLIGILGSDYPDMRTEIAVSPGDSVRRGDPLLSDRKRPGIVVTSPVAGVVEEVTLGTRRRLSLLTVRPEGDAARRFEAPDALTPETVRALLLETGLWSAITARPFGHIPDPGSEPDALFVSATDARPNGPDPRVVVAAEPDAFREGVHVLRHLTAAPVWVCQPEGDYFVHPGGHVRVERVSGPHPAQLAGTQIDRLCPVTGGRTVWQIGYQDVIALGRVMRTGELDMTRTVALAGPLARDPRLLRMPAGAGIEALAATEALPGPRRTISGPAVSGVESRFLRRGHRQITLLPRPEARRHRAWLPDPRRPLRPAPVIPHAALDQALGPDIPAMALIRALTTGDTAEADRLGARALLEEDLALLTYVTGGVEDFGALLRQVLDRLEEGA